MVCISVHTRLIYSWGIFGILPPVQVAGGSGNMVVSLACTLVNVLVSTRKHHQHKLQVMPTASASGVFALIDSRKNTTSASCIGPRPS